MTEFEEALKKARETGWIKCFEELPECYGTLDSVNNNCEECPLHDHCEEVYISNATGVYLQRV